MSWLKALWHWVYYTVLIRLGRLFVREKRQDRRQQRREDRQHRREER